VALPSPADPPRSEIVIVQPYFHVGLVVPDLEAAMTAFGETGVRWRKVMTYPLCVLHAGKRSTVDLRSVYSAGDGPAIELYSGGSATPLAAPVAGSRFHHVGLWADDFPSDVAALRDKGFELAATVEDEHGDPSRFSLHRTPFGFYLELVDPHWAGRLLSDLLPPRLQEKPA
jgi:hypothetical protein